MEKIDYNVDFLSKESNDDLTKDELKEILYKTTEIIENGNPENLLSQAYYDRGLVHILFENYDNAICDNTKSIQLGFRYLWSAYYNRGIAYYDSDQLKPALSDFYTVIQINPHHEYAKHSKKMIDLILQEG